MRKTVLATVAAVLFMAASGSMMLAQAQDKVFSTETDQQQCERESGYWDTVPGVCELGA